MNINEFNELDGLVVKTKQPFILQNVKIPDPLKENSTVNSMFNMVFPVYNSKDYIDMKDPNRIRKVIGFACVHVDKTLEMRILNDGVRNLMKSYSGRNFDSCFDIIPSGALSKRDDGGVMFNLDHFKLRPKPIVKDSIKTAEVESSNLWDKEHINEIRTMKNQVHIKDIDMFLDSLKDAIGDSKVRVKQRKGVVEISKI